MTRTVGTGTARLTAVVFANAGAVEAYTGVLEFGSIFTQSGGVTVLRGGSIAATNPMAFNGGVLAGAGNLEADVHSSGAIIGPGY